MARDSIGGSFYPAGMRPDFGESKDTLWLSITPKNFSVDLSSRTGSGGVGRIESPMWFLMPMEWSFAIQHTWEERSNPIGEIKQIASKVKEEFELVKGVAGQSFGAKGSKNDNPVIYQGSQRRQFNVSLEFSVYSDAKNDVYDPVQRLIEYSSPEIIKESSVDYLRPYVFQIQTYNGQGSRVDIISGDNMAIQTIQPSYKGPWINGYPSHATLDIGLMDLSPLYRSTLRGNRNKAVNISIKSKR